MQLDDFIASTLVQIAKGMKSAFHEVEAAGGWVNPTVLAGNVPQDKTGHTLITIPDRGWSTLQEIEIDIAVTATEERGASAGVSVIAAVVGIGAAGRESIGESSASRIRFKIPMALPTSMIKADK